MNDQENLQPPTALAQILAATAELGFDMASDKLTGGLLRTLAASKPAGRFLELGTGTGVATAWLLDGMDVQSQLITVERNEGYASIARNHLGADQRVTFFVEDAEIVLNKIAGQEFDLIFADTWVGKYTHLDECLQLIKEGGIYIIDDMLPQKNWPEGHAEKVDNLVAELEARSDLSLLKMAWSSGLILAVKFKQTSESSKLNQPADESFG
jgi:predicted O-methyltransferase YrrM